MFCQACGVSLSTKGRICPACGVALANRSVWRSQIKWIVRVILLLCLGLVLAGVYTRQARNAMPAMERDAAPPESGMPASEQPPTSATSATAPARHKSKSTASNGKGKHGREGGTTGETAEPEEDDPAR